jgi:hypothetical protein
MLRLQTIALFMGTALVLNLTPDQRSFSSCPAVSVRGATGRAVSRGNRSSYWACSFRLQEFQRTWLSRLLVAVLLDGLPAAQPGHVSRTGALVPS